MATTIQHANVTAIASFLPATQISPKYAEIFQENRHRVYSLAFWMTDNELMAEEFMRIVFARVFASGSEASPESIDRALVAELRQEYPLGPLTLNEPVCDEVLAVRRNTLRVHLERAVVQVPRTERMIFLLHDVEGHDHARVSRTLGITPDESQAGLHQARLRIRNLVAAMPR
jgi:RNA polymerase sigma-70 factor (ECF subfamily)